MPTLLRFVSRRTFLQLGTLASLGLARPLHAAPPVPGFGRAKSVLIVFTSGGMSQIDTWDPKPSAPAEIRGAFSTIRSSVPGTILGEHLPQVARRAHLYTILRSVSHDDLDHGSACYLTLTGQPHPIRSSNPPPRPTDAPTLGALLQRVRPGGPLPQAAAYLNGPLLVPELVGPGQNGGFLGRAFEPLGVGDVSEGAAAVGGLEPLPDLPPVRVEARRSLLQSVDAYRRRLAGDPALLDLHLSYRQAYGLLATPDVRRAFDLGQEPAALRDRYGRHRSGQACLLGRRLVEAGVPLVTVFFNHSIRGQDRAPGETDAYGWDTHNDIFEALKVHLLPRFDQSFAALLDDLEARGLLETTLVVCLGEFGRAPLVAYERSFAGSSPGRKHWAAVYSIVLAGAGVGRGAVVGSSDRRGAYPQSVPVGPWDVAATIFAALGIDPATEYFDLAQRPYRLAAGRPITALYG